MMHLGMPRHLTTAEPAPRALQVRAKKVGNLLTYEKPYIGGRAQSIQKTQGAINNYFMKTAAYSTSGGGSPGFSSAQKQVNVYNMEDLEQLKRENQNLRDRINNSSTAYHHN